MITTNKSAKRFCTLLVLIGFLVAPANLFSQSFGFGFGDDSDDSYSVSSAPASGVRIAGEINAELKGFFGDFQSAGDMRLGDIFSGRLEFSASGSTADAVINFNLAPVFASPISIDEAYARVFFGPVNIEAGLRKLTWGRADSSGPLDVINPLDYSDLTALSDTMKLKIARPLIHASYRLGSFSKIEAVFVPSFEP